MLTQERLSELLNYDADTGIFTWLISHGSRARVGQLAGTVHSEGYLAITLDSEKYLSHRLAFLYMDGFIPEYSVDHINGLKTDNKWENLRHVNQSCNGQNCKVSDKNTSGYRGVSWKKQRSKWVASLCVNRKAVFLGNYDTALDAALARITAEDWCQEWHCDSRCENRKKVFKDLRS